MNVYPRRFLLAFFLAALGGCSSPPDAPSPSQYGVVSLQFDFNQGPQGWTSGFANYYDQVDPAVYNLTAFFGPIGSPLTGSGLAVTGSNLSSSGLFLYYKHQASGLHPGGKYLAAFMGQIATATPTGCAGAGGAPESVYVKTGAPAHEPLATSQPTSVPGLTASAFNLDIGYQQTDGADAVTMGNVVNSFRCGDPNNGWELKSFPQRTEQVTAAPDGTIWLFTGIQFGAFEGRLGVYFTSFKVTFTPTT